MPSPLGHALAGAAAGWVLAPRRPAHAAVSGIVRDGLLCAGLALLPDVDLLVGWHRGPTHSLVAAALAGAVVGLVSRSGRLGSAAAAAYATHVLLDWLGADSSPPLGLVVFWPFSGAYYESGLQLFPAVSRRYHVAGFWTQNLRAGLFELALLLPPAALALWGRWVWGQPLVKGGKENGRTRERDLKGPGRF